MTYREIITAMQMLSANVGSQETKVQKKLVKIHEKLKKHYDIYAELHSDLKLDYAATDDKDHVIMNEKGEYSYTKDSLKQLTKAVNVLLDTEIDFVPIEILNPQGLEEHSYLKDFTKGIKFTEDE